jgi:hypothetical protein
MLKGGVMPTTELEEGSCGSELLDDGLGLLFVLEEEGELIELEDGLFSSDEEEEIPAVLPEEELTPTEEEEGFEVELELLTVLGPLGELLSEQPK